MDASHRVRFPLFLSLLSFTISLPGYAQTLDPADFANAVSLLLEQATTAVIKGVGFGGDYRTFQSVRGPSGIVGLDIGVSVMVSQVPPEFLSALQSAGYSKPKFAAIPAAHLRVSKSLGEYLSVDAGYAKYKELKVYGIGGQIFTKIDEGPDFALRLSYSNNSLGVVATDTWTPSVMVGKKLSFFEPYLGVGYQITRGIVEIPITLSGNTLNFKTRGSATSLIAYAGLSLNILLVQIVFEGNYSAAGVPGLGVKLGLRF